MWCGCFFGLCGLHRFYNKKFCTGILWLLTFGLFGIGQFVDLFLMPSMVEEHNWTMRRKVGMSPTGIPLAESSLHPTLTTGEPRFRETQPLSQEQLMVKLTQAAQKRGGKISVTQAVLDTGVSFEEVEKTLKKMLKQGYVEIDNDPKTGIVIYDFWELS